MTTNVRDSVSNRFAADSRWSIDLRPYFDAILYIDDYPYGKIVKTRGRAYMFAGDSRVIDQWKTLIATAEANGENQSWERLDVNGMAVSMVSLTNGEVEFEYGHEIRLPDQKAERASFAGTGSVSACKCWQVNGDPVKAVNTAKDSDIFTGGVARHLDFFTGVNNNLVTETSLTALNNAIRTEGMIMEIKNGSSSTSMVVKDALTNRNGLQAALEKVRLGELAPTAPCDAVYNNWSDKERKKLVAAMNKGYATA